VGKGYGLRWFIAEDDGTVTRVPAATCQRWLESRPEPRLLTAWTHLVQGLIESMSPAEAASLHSGLLDRARAVATASGGFLGLGSRISAAEESAPGFRRRLTKR
jgi:ferric-dicitrate binding protein FerR (iron transport regulator)